MYPSRVQVKRKELQATLAAWKAGEVRPSARWPGAPAEPVTEEHVQDSIEELVDAMIDKALEDFASDLLNNKVSEKY